MAFKKGQSGNPSGRPKGSSTVPRFADYVTDEQRREFVSFIVESYMGDMGLAKWFGDNAFIKLAQSIDHTTNGKDLPSPILAHVQGDNSAQEDSGAA